jgi:hypothetical protein
MRLAHSACIVTDKAFGHRHHRNSSGILRLTFVHVAAKKIRHRKWPPRRGRAVAAKCADDASHSFASDEASRPMAENRSQPLRCGDAAARRAEPMKVLDVSGLVAMIEATRGRSIFSRARGVLRTAKGRDISLAVARSRSWDGAGVDCRQHRTDESGHASEDSPGYSTDSEILPETGHSPWRDTGSCGYHWSWVGSFPPGPNRTSAPFA